MRSPVRPRATSTASSWSAFSSASPPTAAAADPTAINVGVEFYVTSSGLSLTSILWWQPTTGNDTSSRTVACYTDAGGATVATGQTQAVAGVGWQTVTLSTPVALTANAHYRAVVYHPGGQYAGSNSYFTGADIVNGPLVVPSSANATGNAQGSFTASGGVAFTSSTFSSSNYWVDVVVQ